MERDDAAAHIAEAAAIEAARGLRAMGFDEARADGPDIIARKGKTTWRLINRVRSAPGIRERLLDRFVSHLMSGLVNRLPSTERKS